MNAMPAPRLPDWPARLVAFFEERDRQAFSWGVNDCCTFAAAAVRATTGADLLAALPQRWDDASGAARVLRRERGLAGAVTARLGPPLPTPALAQRGDVVLVRADIEAWHVRFLAVCDSDRWAAPHYQGVLRGPMSQALKAWRVGAWL